MHQAQTFHQGSWPLQPYGKNGLQQIPAERWLRIRFEDLVADQGHAYGKIREFLEFDQPWSEEAKSVLMSPTVISIASPMI